MVKHVIVDGSNLATEGRAQPSLAQLNEAVLAFIEEFPDVKVTVVVDATFGHRINKKELAEFNEAVDNNELVAPPAGAVGRGDAFVLSIADKVKAAVLSNDSYQEFHGKYPWLFDEGRLIGGKPVPHIGWVFVERVPVRGSTSRRAMKAGGKIVAKEPPKPSPEASKPMPVPKAPPPSTKRPANTTTKAVVAKTAGKKVSPKTASQKVVAKSDVSKKEQVQAKPTNTADVMAYLTFVEKHPVGSTVKGVVDGFAANGVIVKIGEIRGYAPLRLLGNPAPRRPRDVFAMGQSVTLMIAGYTAARRSVDLGLADVVSSSLNKSALDKKQSVEKSARKKTLVKKVSTKKAIASSVAKKDVVKAPIKKASASKSSTAKTVANKAVQNKTVQNKTVTTKTSVKKSASKPGTK